MKSGTYSSSIKINDPEGHIAIARALFFFAWDSQGRYPVDMKPGETGKQTIAILGGTGRFGVPYIREFLLLGFQVKILARKPGKIARRFPGTPVVAGSMLALPDVKRAMSNAAAAFLMTPVGGNDDPRIELEAAEIAIAGARATGLPHLVHLSLLQQPRPTGVPVLDVKGEIEARIRDSGLSWSSLRTGCYMDAWLDFFPAWMKRGIYLFPIQSRHRFSFTAQQDVARIAARLIRQNRPLNGPLDIIEPRTRTLVEVADLYTRFSGRPLFIVGRWILPVLRALKPVFFSWYYPEGASRIKLFNYFNHNDWTGNAGQLSKTIPGFQVTTMEHHLQTRQRLPLV